MRPQNISWLAGWTSLLLRTTMLAIRPIRGSHKARSPIAIGTYLPTYQYYAWQLHGAFCVQGLTMAGYLAPAGVTPVCGNLMSPWELI
jgi:hypothetical protein